MKVSCGDLRRHKVVREPEAWVVVAATGGECHKEMYYPKEENHNRGVSTEGE